MDDKRRHFGLWKKEKLVDLLCEKETRIEELENRLGVETREASRLGAQLTEWKASNLEYRTQINLMAEKLGKREAQNTDFDNSLVIEASDSLREIATKVTEEAEAENALKIQEMNRRYNLAHHDRALTTQISITKLQADVAKSQFNACARQYQSYTDQWKHRNDTAREEAHASRDRWIAMYSHNTVQTGIRWIIGAAALVSGVYLYLSF